LALTLGKSGSGGDTIFLVIGKINLIGLLTGGGDAPGLNAVIRAVVKTAVTRYKWSVIGFEDGFEGLIGKTQASELTLDSVRGLLPRGGSILGCANKGHFTVKQVEGRLVQQDPPFDEAIANIRRLGVDALVVIGGDGTQFTGHQFSIRGVPVVGVPKTIDNDLAETELTFGFDTALDIATEAIDRLHTTAESHDRVMLVEVMGRHAGWIALEAGISGGADVILIPEIPFDMKKVAAKVLERESLGRKFSIVVAAEGARPIGGEPVYQQGGVRLGGIAERVGADLLRLTGKDTRVVVLGHLQRGGSPTAFDRLLASCLGSAAVHAIADGRVDHLVAWRCGEISTVPLEQVIKGVKQVPLDHFLVRCARDLGISLAGDAD
jgi:6-phosphofructokinase 1